MVRACIMVVFVLAAPLFQRDSDPPTTLSAALFLILLANPFAAASISCSCPSEPWRGFSG